MTLYASTDITGHYDITCPTGGHARKVINATDVRKKGAKPIYEGDRLVIDCTHCEPYLGRLHDSWSSDPNDPALLSQEERNAAEVAKEQGLAVTAELANALVAAAAKEMAGRS